MENVTYIAHSGFLIETQDAYFLFDYYQGELPVFDRSKTLVVFVSHSHEDHYNPAIFNLLKETSHVQYVLAKGTPVKRHVIAFQQQGLDLESHLLFVKRRTQTELTLSNKKKITITTLRSTDIGVAYIVQYQERCYYHAGDFNLWLWDGETKQFNNNMKKNFFDELETIRGRHFDVACVPLDPRLEGHAMEGLEAFMEYTDSNRVFPMHCWGEYSIIERFVEKHPEYADRIVQIKKEGAVTFL